MTDMPTDQPGVADDYDDGGTRVTSTTPPGAAASKDVADDLAVRTIHIPLVYVIGPYRAKTEWDLVRNIRSAEEVALQVWQAGAAAICPHKNTAHFGGAGGASDDVWMRGDFEMMLRCDACVTAGNYHDSKGSQAEIRIARANGIPVFHSVYALLAWLSPRIKAARDRKAVTTTPAVG